MTRAIYFDSPFLLGFEQTRASMERAAQSAAESYPPYNVEARGESGIRISLAVAGFKAEQLEVLAENGQLTVSGRREPETDQAEPRAFVHRGIAARGFTRAFVLGEGLEVEAATLEHGVLHVDLARPEPKPGARTIPVRHAV